MSFLQITHSRVHNLKNVSVKIPKNKLTVITGLSGSGKSSLAFDTIYAEGQRRYAESLNAYARQFMDVQDKPDVDEITGLSPTIAIDQKNLSQNPRSTVGTATEIYDLLRLLYSRVGQQYCPECNIKVEKKTAGGIIETVRKMKMIASSLAKELGICGPFNIQFLAKNNELKVIECNLRASRSMPFVSKVTGTNFLDIATKAIMGKKIECGKHNFLELDHVGVKAPQFSFSRLKGADPVSGVEMASTGEVACIGSDFEDAFLKALLSTGYNIPQKSILVSLTGDSAREKMLPELSSLCAAGYIIYATEHTCQFLQENRVRCKMIYKMHENKKPNVLGLFQKGKIDLAIIVPDPFQQIATDPKYDVRRFAIDYNVPLITNLQIASAFVRAITKKKITELEIMPWSEYVK